VLITYIPYTLKMDLRKGSDDKFNAATIKKMRKGKAKF